MRYRRDSRPLPRADDDRRHGPAAPFGVAVSLIALSTAARAQEPGEGAGSSLVATSEHFELHSHPWISLHHFLYQWARSESPRSPRDTRPPAVIPEKEALAAWSEGERGEWEAAWRGYAELALARSLVFDEGMVAAKAVLAAMDPAVDEPTDEAFEALGELAAPLAAAMPLYRAHFWDEHDATNRAWIAAQAELLTKYEAELAPRLTHAFGGSWPETRIRVDVAPHTNWAGAYTTNDPDHIVMSSTDEALQGLLGLETVFHESCHTSSVEGGHMDALGAAFTELGAEAPERLWHSMIFYTTGELMRDVLRTHGIEEYETYAERSRFYERASWAGLREAFDAAWKPWLDGASERQAAYEGVARRVAGG